MINNPGGAAVFASGRVGSVEMALWEKGIRNHWSTPGKGSRDEGPRAWEAVVDQRHAASKIEWPGFDKKAVGRGRRTV
jgi:hypothetical protein